MSLITLRKYMGKKHDAYIRFISKIRTCYYRQLFAKMGKGTYIQGPITVYNPWNISIGNYCTINENVVLNARDKIIIGDNARISSGVIIICAELDFKNGSLPYKHSFKPISIGIGVWIAAGAIITAGTTIGAGAIVGAGAVVIEDVSENAVVGGVPARIINYRKE